MAYFLWIQRGGRRVGGHTSLLYLDFDESSAAAKVRFRYITPANRLQFMVSQYSGAHAGNIITKEYHVHHQWAGAELEACSLGL